MANESGYTASLDDRETLLSSPWMIRLHTEAPAALDRFGARYRLAIIRNTDDGLITGTLAVTSRPGHTSQITGSSTMPTSPGM